MIRAATEQDIEALLELGAAMVAESPLWRQFPYDRERSAATLRALMHSPNGQVLVAERDHQVVGTMLLEAGSHWACEVEVISELVLYVTPAARGSSIAARLIAEMVHWASSRVARPQLLRAGSSTDVNTELTIQLYRRLGFDHSSIGLERVHV